VKKLQEEVKIETPQEPENQNEVVSEKKENISLNDAITKTSTSKMQVVSR
jgi:hypothetical protein